MKYVYLLKSLSYPDQIYTGITGNKEERLAQHNRREVSHTSKFAPWEMVFYTAFKNKDKAYEFEKYLKSHSGRAFVKKRLI